MTLKHCFKITLVTVKMTLVIVKMTLVIVNMTLVIVKMTLVIVKMKAHTLILFGCRFLQIKKIRQY